MAGHIFCKKLYRYVAQTAKNYFPALHLLAAAFSPFTASVGGDAH